MEPLPLKTGPLPVLAVLALSVGVAACGGAGRGTNPASPASKTTVAGVRTVSTVSSSQALHLRGDEDDDDEAGEQNGSSEGDKDADFDNDTKDRLRGYTDGDDTSVLAFGRAASVTETRAVTAVVKRYYAAAAAEDGARACALVTSVYLIAIPEDYGRTTGPSYMRGKTCSIALSGLFKHEHKRLVTGVKLTGARIAGNRAYVLVGSRTLPASYLTLEREASGWRVSGLLGVPLP
jgi:hypothetical protein